MAEAVDAAAGDRAAGPLLLRPSDTRLTRISAYRWIRELGDRALGKHVHPHVLRHAFVTLSLDAGASLRDVQIAARHADPRMTAMYDRARGNLKRHAAHLLADYVTGTADGGTTADPSADVAEDDRTGRPGDRP
ncbi:tyrosine-type recombinase/integrase [Georgenia sp. SUBG003]|uniref:tyrosine-type recombinase/integrase n=1 Tax=Georgenia sp. SUBG003 TaxID=1497974 RepID=UPI003AB47E4C